MPALCLMQNNIIALNIRLTIQEYNMLEPNDAILCGCSGGADSVCLVCALLELREKFRFELGVLHVNHNLRENSRKDAEYTQELARRFGLSFFLREIKIEKKSGIEEAARNARYKAYIECAKENGFNKIATGHTRSDLIETFIMNLGRGAGLRGLGSIPPVRFIGDNIKIIRPLIDIDRAQTEEYLKELGIGFVIDETNADPAFLRNKIRKDVAPVLRKFASNEKISTAARIAREASDYLENQGEKLMKEAARSLSGALELDIKILLKDGVFIAKYALMAAADFLNLELSRERIEDLLRLCAMKNGSSLKLPKAVAWREYDALVIGDIKPAQTFFYNLKPGEIIKTPSGDLIACGVSLGEGALEKVFDYDKISRAAIRSRLPGDYIFFKNGRKLIKREFIDKKIPKRLRGAIPLLAVENEVFWVMTPTGRANQIFLENSKTLLFSCKFALEIK